MTNPSVPERSCPTCGSTDPKTVPCPSCGPDAPWTSTEGDGSEAFHPCRDPFHNPPAVPEAPERKDAMSEQHVVVEYGPDPNAPKDFPREPVPVRVYGPFDGPPSEELHTDDWPFTRWTTGFKAVTLYANQEAALRA